MSDRTEGYVHWFATGLVALVCPGGSAYAPAAAGAAA